MAATGRHHWIQADLRCMLCGRVEGRVYGPAPVRQPVTRACRLNQFSSFRAAASTGPVVPLNGTERFRCSVCRGPVLLDDLECFTIYDEEILDEDENRRPRRGRPPKPWRQPRDRRLDELGLAG